MLTVSYASLGLNRTEMMKNRMLRALDVNPMGPMLREPEVIRYITKEALEIEIIDESTNEYIDQVFSNLIKSGEFKKLKLNEEEIKKYKSKFVESAMLFKKTKFNNEFSVIIYEKNKLKNIPIRYNLANFSISFLAPMSLFIDQLVADARTTLAGGSTTINKALVNGKIQDLRVDRLWLLAENKDHYFIVEIGFSPLTHASMNIWSELEGTLKSFSVLTQDR